MADPVVTDWYKAQWIWKGRSALPEDVYVNTFAFRNQNIVGQGQMVDDIEAVLRAFFIEVEPIGARSIVSYLSNIIGAEAELRIYDLGQLPPRQPIVRKIPALPARASSGLPSEVAATLSYYADQNLPRQRGRIYLGPLGTGASDLEPNTNRIRLHEGFMNCVLDRWLNMVRTSREAKLGVLSRASATALPVTHAWMDDAFDTQRRRGEAAARRFVRAK